MSEYRCHLFDGIVRAAATTVENPFNGKDHLVVRFHRAEFLVDFAGWKAGHRPYSLTFDPGAAVLSETNNWDEIVRRASLKVVAVDDVVADAKKDS